MIYSLAFIFLFGIGGLTGLFLGALAVDVHLHDTYFIVAHFHYTMMGGVMIAFLAGLHHWWPKMFGRMYSEKWARIGALLVFVGFNVTFFTQFMMGSKGMPRRYFNYPPEFEVYHVISSIGSYVLAIGLFVTLGYLVHSLVAGRRAPNNPWGAATLEWQAASPPDHYNFTSEPVVDDPYNYEPIVYDEEIGGYRRVDREPEEATV
jgi:cytochrome c oxidase subunit 1